MFYFVAVIVVALLLFALGLSLRIVKQYEQGVLFRFGRVVAVLAARAAVHHSLRRRAA